jgi:hypothetical protein
MEIEENLRLMVSPCKKMAFKKKAAKCEKLIFGA